jgi:hypothetical protein
MADTQKPGRTNAEKIKGIGFMSSTDCPHVCPPGHYLFAPVGRLVLSLVKLVGGLLFTIPLVVDGMATELVAAESVLELLLQPAPATMAKPSIASDKHSQSFTIAFLSDRRRCCWSTTRTLRPHSKKYLSRSRASFSQLHRDQARIALCKEETKDRAFCIKKARCMPDLRAWTSAHLNRPFGMAT